MPLARVVFVKVLDDDGRFIEQRLMVRIPFKVWREHYDMWIDMKRSLWCRPVIGVAWGRKYRFKMWWEPLTKD